MVTTERRPDEAVGRSVRFHRKQQGLSLEQASELTGLSVSMISKIERGLTSPSVRSLYALSHGLKIPVGTLFSDHSKMPAVDREDLHAEEEAGLVVRKSARRTLDFGEKRLVKELLTPQPIGTLELLMIVLSPGGSTGDDVFSHDGEEGGVVLSGALELWVDEKRLLLYPGDSFTFKSRRPHRFSNAADEETRVLWINTPPIY
ncbi:MAG: cupin domain-containing protein [Aurantimonas endophytica]|uniref:Transcriptional regulator with XRE-family HTH domain n=1 Tax=Aurantimonas endophytica TaxID=1522175 RepID=A0A7W6HCT9_9HYPH|nr:cupin domain-containing protein [Aurantimonas endophytica]MBB4002608.1 transcriptional regulator with XRE-family HTH domain [Aurantimonas endophytica]MCO6403489.1 cupin domain-containing protein [Aurantimonas endophytica]